MKKYFLTIMLSLYAASAFAQPDIVQLLALNDSLVQVSVELPNGTTGSGSGVVVSKEYVATNCHVLANAKGASISKYRDSHRPIAMKADWKHDVCLLKFEGLPFKPVLMRDSESLQYEEEIFSLGYPVGNNVPQPSFGYVKGSYPLDGSVIIRTNAAFGLGSSGGALFDQQFNLIGITSFKSPGAQGYFYSLPVAWIKRLFDAPDSISLSTNDTPFWALPLEKRPYFMQIVIPYQNHEWTSLKKIAQAWTGQEPQSADAWYFLGLAEEGGNQILRAKENFSKAQQLNARHLDAMIALSKIAYSQGDFSALEQLKAQMLPISQQQAEAVAEKMSDLKKN